MKILTGKKAKDTVTKILKKHEPGILPYPGPRVAGYFWEEGKFTAFDNTAGECFMERFRTKRRAEDWCRGKFEVV